MSENSDNKTNNNLIRVLWIAQSCSLQDEEDNLLLTGRTEHVMTKYGCDRIQLAVAYMADGKYEKKFTKNGIIYFAVDGNMRIGIQDKDWEKTKAELLRIIAEFSPDIIQCFGAEWPYGLIAEDVKIPVVIHMMGFLNIYFLSIHMARRDSTQSNEKVKRVKIKIRNLFCDSQLSEGVEDRCRRTERRVMSSNRFFFGRTEWDSNIVRYYSPNSRYFKVQEAVKPCIFDSAGQWKYHDRDKIRIFSLSSADDRKGNEIILRTAEICKTLLGLNFVWRVAGHKDFFPYFEQRSGIRHEEMNIELLGMIDSREIIKELKEADFFVHPSIIDNSPHAVCEAQLIGCPVIASNVGGVPDLVEDGETGFLFPYNEPHTLAFLIANLSKKERVLSEISEKEVHVARERHNPEAIANIMIETYKTIISDYQTING